MSRIDQVTLVCGGGGVWGIAWMTGVAMGLADRGVDLREAGAFIGTSAGSVVAAQWAKGLNLEDLFARQADLARQPPEPAPDAAAMARLMEAMQRPFANREERRQAMRRLALEAPTISASERRANLVVRLGLPNECLTTATRRTMVPGPTTARAGRSATGGAGDRERAAAGESSGTDILIWAH
jgi:hypothetical protein